MDEKLRWGELVNPPGSGSVGPAGPPGVVANVVHKTSAYTASGGDVVLADATTAAFSVTVPVTLNTRVDIKKVDSSPNTVTILLASGVFSADGFGTSVILTAQGQSRTVVCDGTNGYII